MNRALSNCRKMGPPLPAIWSLCTFVIGCFLLLSNLYCKSSTTMKPVEVLTSTRSNNIQQTRKTRKMTLFNLTCPLFEVFENNYEKSKGHGDSVSNNLQYFKLKKDIVTHLPVEYGISGRSICLSSEVTLLIIIPSIVEDASLRIAIRETWASEIYASINGYDNYDIDPVVRLAFFFGAVGLSTLDKMILQEESNVYGDIVTIDMIESYKNLSLKVASSLKWSMTMCPQVKYIAKVDVDTMLNVQLLLRLLEQVADNDAVVLGHQHVFLNPYVTRSGKWAVSKDIYPLQHFPSYVYGHSYVMTRTAMNRFVSSFPYFPIVPNEDAFITGIMPLVANVSRVHSAAFTHLFRQQTCREVQYGRFVSTIHRKSNLRHVWLHLNNGNCSKDNVVSW